MEITERIHRVKDRLRYCGNEEILLKNKEALAYFKDFFHERPRPKYNNVFGDFTGYTLEIGLYLGTTGDNPTLHIKYNTPSKEWGCYDDYEFIIFNDDEAHYKNGYWGDRNNDDSLYVGELEYSDIDDEIWEIIENEALENANNLAAKGLEAAQDSVSFYESRIIELNRKFNNEKK